MSERIGQQIGNYRLQRLLGQGGFAQVYLGEHIHLGTYAAIKLLHTRLTLEDTELFKQEARTLARLNHPYIVRVFDFGVDNGTPFLVMDYAPGGTLRTRYPPGSHVPLSIVVEYVKQVALALQYAHDQSPHVIHRDVKPENMLIAHDGRILLGDFGIAMISQSSRYQSTKDMAGTIAYMAPEQIESHPRPASDQYSLGIVVYEWLSGTRPFHGSFTEVAVKHSITPPPPLRQHLPSLSPAVEQVIMIALAKKPEERFGSMRAFATALEQASASTQHAAPSSMTAPSMQVTLPVMPPIQMTQPSVVSIQNTQPAVPPMQTPPATPLQATLPAMTPVPDYYPATNNIGASPPDRLIQTNQEKKDEVSRRVFLIGVTVVATATLTGAGVWWFTRSSGAGGSTYLQPSPTPQPAHQPSPTSGSLQSPRGTRFVLYRGHTKYVDAVAWSPDGKHIVSSSNDKTAQVWNALDGTLLFTYSGHANAVTAVAWSPDGTRIASASSDNTVQVWNAVNGNLLFTYSGHTATVWSVIWSPDSTRIASGSADNTVQVWNAANGGGFTYKGHANIVWSVAWSSNGTRIASASSDRTVQIWNPTNGNTSFTYQGHSAAVTSVRWSPDDVHIASSSADKTAQVWDPTNGNTFFTYHGHSGNVNAVAWSPDGKHIVSASWDKTAQVWGAFNGSNPFTYSGHSDYVTSAMWSPDGTRIVTGSGDKTVQVWQAV